MKIINKTTWDTKQLRKLFNRVCKEETFTTNVVEVVYTKKPDKYFGRASYYRRWIKMGLPNKTRIAGNNAPSIIKELDELNSHLVADIFAHELQHNMGFRHKDMGKGSRFYDENVRVPYAEGFVIKRQEIKSKPKRDLRKERYNHALKKLQEYKSKSKRIGNLLKKWQRKVKYYEKVLN